MQSKYNVEHLFNEMNIAKQELVQSDSKIGWSAAFFAILISSLISLGETSEKWIIIGPILSLPLLSLVILIIAIVPEIKIKNNKNIKISDWCF